MKMLGHDGAEVRVEVEGLTLQLTHCLDRYVAWSTEPPSQPDERVEIWEDELGHVVRLNRPLQSDGPWDAQAWV